MDSAKRARQLAASPLGWMPGDSPSPGRRSRERRAAAASRRFLQPSDPRPQILQERWRLTVSGRVQGVGYRQATLREAQALELGGWVRNCADGCVEIEVEGPLHKLNDLRLWCERGPAAAQVHRVATTQVAATGSDWFEIRS
jgi:acylphosphatase